MTCRLAYMVARRFMVVALVALLMTFIPPSSADDNIQSANTLIEGVSASGQVCYDDGCSPNDEVDWWKIYAYMGDIVQVGFSGSMNNGAWWCPGDGWEADYSLHDYHYDYYDYATRVYASLSCFS